MSHAAIKTSASSPTALLAALHDLEKALTQFMPDKPEVIKVTLSAIIANGHLLLDDVPGIGKTSFVKLVARLLGLSMKRVQFTADLLPADIIGVETYQARSQDFHFHEGPIFTNILLADEINRSSPRTQSALLEAMGEGSVTVDRTTRALPEPFMVIATQNPADSIGTYPLPESQLDRFAARLCLDYPARQKEISIFQSLSRDPLASFPEAILDADSILRLRRLVDEVHLSERVAQTIHQVLHATRQHPRIRQGVSTRGGVLWARLARAHAFLQGRDYVIPDDLFSLALACLTHRIVPVANTSARELIMEVITSVIVA